MPARIAYDFAPDVRHFYNASGATISKGHGVQRDVTTVNAIPDPGREDPTPTLEVFSIAKAYAPAAGNEMNFLGVATEDITDASWGPVCIGGICDCLMTNATAWAVGTPLRPGVAASAGAFIISTTPHAIVAATVRVSNTSTTAGTLVKCFIEPIRQPGGGGHGYVTA